MTRIVCFIDESDGQYGTCLQEETGVDCGNCERNPFPDKIVPGDRILRDIYTAEKITAQDAKHNLGVRHTEKEERHNSPGKHRLARHKASRGRKK